MKYNNIFLKFEELKMDNLSTEMNDSLNQYVIGLLNKNSIYTVTKFLCTDPKKLMSITNIDLWHLSAIKRDLSKYIGIRPIDGQKHHEILTKQFTPLPTGIKSLDEMLNGGLQIGQIIDICGLPASGKTQLHTTVAINFAIECLRETIVIDTKGDFSGQRIHHMLSHRKIDNSTELKDIMDRIKVHKCDDPDHLIEFIEKLITNIDSYENLQLLVIDSLPALWFLYHGNTNAIGLRKLSEMMHLLRKLAVEHGVIVLTVNIVTRFINTCEPVINEDPDASSNDSMSSTPTNNADSLVPALGRYWQSVPSLRLLLERPKEATSPNQRIIQILKGNQFKTGDNCRIQISDIGLI